MTVRIDLIIQTQELKSENHTEEISQFHSQKILHNIGQNLTQPIPFHTLTIRLRLLASFTPGGLCKVSKCLSQRVSVAFLDLNPNCKESFFGGSFQPFRLRMNTLLIKNYFAFI